MFAVMCIIFIIGLIVVSGVFFFVFRKNDSDTGLTPSGKRRRKTDGEILFERPTVDHRNKWYG